MKLHLARVIEGEPTLEYRGYSSYGVIGTDTSVLDCNGESIYVGCMVKVTKKEGGWWSNLVCEFEKISGVKYFSVMGMSSKTIQELVENNKVEVVMPFSCLDVEYRRHLHFISLGSDYMEESYDWIDGDLVQVRNFRK
jgi:hypothetical protein